MANRNRVNQPGHRISSLACAGGDPFPRVGLGTWKVAKPAAAALIEEAVRLGYRHFDCACDYGNEREVGAGLRAVLNAGLCRREDLWITSKLWNTYHAPEHVAAALERSLNDLGLDYLDTYLIHFPIALKYVPFDVRYPPEWIHDPTAAEPRMEFAAVPIHETWQAMEALARSGRVRHVGVCNFNCALLRDLLAAAEIPPAMLQVELHPFLTQERLLRFCRDHEIAVTAYSPFGASSYLSIGMAQVDESVLEDPVIRAIAERHQKTPAQVVLRWGVQRGTAVIPKASRADHLRENLSLFDFELSDEEMRQISGLNRNRRFNDPGEFCESAFRTFCPIYD